jgi:flagellar protein FlaG
MPTEITTEMRQASSPVAESSRLQQKDGVVAADKVVARQGSTKDEQKLPPAKDSSQTSNQQLDEAAGDLNNYVQSLKRDLHFSVDADSGETIIRVVDSANQKLIRTIPSDEFLSISKQLNQSVGMLLNAKV